LEQKTSTLSPSRTVDSKSRIAYLDGLRGVAILLVVAFHFYHGPGSALAEFSLVKYGNLGVMLFFAISGFVISQTLHASASPKNFAIKRFARLFPAMLLCSSLTFAFSFVGPRNYSSTVGNFLPSLTFIDPHVFNAIFRVDSFEWMDPSYWSLFTEMRFYAIAAILYFIDKPAFFRNFLIFAVVIGLIFPMAIYLQVGVLRSSLNYLFIANQLPWFVFGIACYCLHRGDMRNAVLLSAASCISLLLYCIAASTKPYMDTAFEGTVTLIGALFIFTLLICAMRSSVVSRLLSFKPLASIGIASYTLYLLHQLIGKKLVLILNDLAPLNGSLSQLYPLVALAILIAGSRLLYKHYENPSNRRINQSLIRSYALPKAVAPVGVESTASNG
jgi:peptidoglycan/LPS O-acetylase OafA/YrhL